MSQYRDILQRGGMPADELLRRRAQVRQEIALAKQKAAGIQGRIKNLETAESRLNAQIEISATSRVSTSEV